MTDLDPDYLVQDEAALRDLFPPTHEVALAKCMTEIDKHARDFIERSPFLCIGTQSKDGTADVSPRGDPRGFVKVLDPRRILIPDRPGNNRLDSLSNIVANPAVGLLFMIPGFDETLRINGRAKVSRDPALLEMGAVQGRLPKVAIVVEIEELFLHCAKAFRRGKLWDPSEHQNRKEMPSLLNIVHEQIEGAPAEAEEQRKMDDLIEDSYRKTMY